MPSGIRRRRPRSRPVTSPAKSLLQRRAVARVLVVSRPGPEQSPAEKPPQAKAEKAPARRANRRNPESPANHPSRNAEQPILVLFLTAEPANRRYAYRL